MALPGFNANASLYRSAAHYVSTHGWSESDGATFEVDGTILPYINISEFRSRTTFEPAKLFKVCGPCNSQCEKTCGESLFSGCPILFFSTTHTENCCTGGTVCANGTCVCPPNLTLCNGTCVDLLSSDSNCSRCGVRCSIKQQCCSGACKDLGTDPQNCGTCGQSCPTTCTGSTRINCSNGVCSPHTYFFWVQSPRSKCLEGFRSYTANSVSEAMQCAQND